MDRNARNQQVSDIRATMEAVHAAEINGVPLATSSMPPNYVARFLTLEALRASLLKKRVYNG